jgi:NADH dehydrogenase
MRIAITGGTGFIGHHLAKSLIEKGHEVVLIARGMDKRNQSIIKIRGVRFESIGIDDEEKLFKAFNSCDAVAHCAGINRELNPGDYYKVHIIGTENVTNAAKRAGVKKLLLTSFYKARPHCKSPYHESKFAAEEIIRNSGLDYTVLKPGMIYGKGDHMLDHLSHIFHTLPLFGLVGFREKLAAPLALEDLIRIIESALLEKRLARQTLAILGPEKMTLKEAVERVAKVTGKAPILIPMPIFFHYGLARVLEAVMRIPLVSIAQVRILTEGFNEPYGECQNLPLDLQPTVMFTEDQIRKGLPQPKSFGFDDLRCFEARSKFEGKDL